MFRRVVLEDFLDGWDNGMGTREFRARMVTVREALRKCRYAVEHWEDPVSPGVYLENMKKVTANFNMIDVYTPPNRHFIQDYRHFHRVCNDFNEETKRMLAEEGHTPPGEIGSGSTAPNKPSEAEVRLQTARVENQTARINASVASSQAGQSAVGSWAQSVARHNQGGQSIAGPSRSRARTVAPGDSASQVTSRVSSRPKTPGGIYVAPGATLNIENYSAPASKVGSSRSKVTSSSRSHHPSAAGKVQSPTKLLPLQSPVNGTHSIRRIQTLSVAKISTLRHNLEAHNAGVGIQSSTLLMEEPFQTALVAVAEGLNNGSAETQLLDALQAFDCVHYVSVFAS